MSFYLDVDTARSNVAKIHETPPIYLVKDFLTREECAELMRLAKPLLESSMVQSKTGANCVSENRTSHTCYLDKSEAAEVVRKIEALTGCPANRMEIPQVARYTATQQYKYHHDADENETFKANGGQRVGTVLIYLNDVASGGETHFKHLDVSIRPQRGSALVFFPATLDGAIDEKALHCARPAKDVKWVSQVWIRQRECTDGMSSRSLRHKKVIGDFLSLWTKPDV